MERLTIDEVILKEKIICAENQKIVDTHVLCEKFTFEELYCDDTEVIEESLRHYKFASEYHKQLAEWLEELKAYKTAEEQGLLLRLPWAIGTTVWFVGSFYVNDYEIRRYIIDETGVGCVQVAKEIDRMDYWNSFYIDDFGKTVFLTREEAEQALAEMQKGK